MIVHGKNGASTRKSLVNQAKALKRTTARVNLTQQDLELALALLAGDVTCDQAATVWKIARTNAPGHTFFVLRHAHLRGWLSVAPTKKRARAEVET